MAESKQGGPTSTAPTPTPSSAKGQRERSSGDDVTVGDVVAAMESLYPPRLAEDWDSIGLICGDPESRVRSILMSVDPTEEASMEAVDRGVDMLITHHPLYLSGVTSMASVSSKGRLLHRLIGHRIALFTAHTNADAALPGVSDALALALGLDDVKPLQAGATADNPGLGRIGRLPKAIALTDFADQVAASLPITMRGINVSGDLMWPVQTVAVCGGSGNAVLGDADAAGADVLVTADLRYHRALEHRADGQCFMIDVSHWASEWPWLQQAADALSRRLSALPGGASVEIVVSEESSDPWTAHRKSPDE